MIYTHLILIIPTRSQFKGNPGYVCEVEIMIYGDGLKFVSEKDERYVEILIAWNERKLVSANDFIFLYIWVKRVSKTGDRANVL